MPVARIHAFVAVPDLAIGNAPAVIEWRSGWHEGRCFDARTEFARWVRAVFEVFARARLAVLCAALVLLAACSADPIDPRPSILLVVVDTLRADAVSAYGKIEGTTPNLDALARGGLLYTNAFAPSPWTLPSHASILTGLAIDEHRVGIGGQMGLPSAVVTLAERLREAGYQTAGFSENPLVSDGFGMDQGFEHFRAVTIEDVMAEAESGQQRFDSIREVRQFLEQRDAGSPFFVFVNLFDPHSPYLDRELDRFVPPALSGLNTWTPKRLMQSPYWICDRLPGDDDLAVLHGFYLGDVAEMDRKFGQIESAVRGAAPGAVWVVATADHGEQFGEHRLLDHEFTVRNGALRVPLIASGLPGATGEVLESAVQLSDIAPTLLDAAIPGSSQEANVRVLPTSPISTTSTTPTRTAVEETGLTDLFAVYSDDKLKVPDDWESDLDVQEDTSDAKRAGCTASDRVFGNMASLIRWPYKLIWFEHHPPELYDLSWDPEERSNQVDLQPELVEELMARLRGRVAASGLDRSSAADAPLPAAEDLEALEALGYLD